MNKKNILIILGVLAIIVAGILFLPRAITLQNARLAFEEEAIELSRNHVNLLMRDAEAFLQQNNLDGTISESSIQVFSDHLRNDLGITSENSQITDISVPVLSFKDDNGNLTDRAAVGTEVIIEYGDNQQEIIDMTYIRYKKDSELLLNYIGIHDYEIGENHSSEKSGSGNSKLSIQAVDDVKKEIMVSDIVNLENNYIHITSEDVDEKNEPATAKLKGYAIPLDNEGQTVNTHKQQLSFEVDYIQIDKRNEQWDLSSLRFEFCIEEYCMREYDEITNYKI